MLRKNDTERNVKMNFKDRNYIWMEEEKGYQLLMSLSRGLFLWLLVDSAVTEESTTCLDDVDVTVKIKNNYWNDASQKLPKNPLPLVSYGILSSDTVTMQLRLN